MSMFDPRTAMLIHAHEEDLVPFQEHSVDARLHEDVASHDPELKWARAKRIFACPRCGEEVMVVEHGDKESA
jgi:predicted RNA-binding Zn-ribbon protein involved in translation (DUF1610 family)